MAVGDEAKATSEITGSTTEGARTTHKARDMLILAKTEQDRFVECVAKGH